MKTRATMVLAQIILVGLCYQPSSASAGVINGIENGDFSESGTDPAEPFPGWETPFFPLDFPPFDGGGHAVFTVDGFEFVELEQTFTLPTGADKLTFDVLGFGATPGTLDPNFLGFDSFQVTLIPLSGTPFLPAFYQVDVPTGDEFFLLGATKSTAGTVSLGLAGLDPGDYTLEFLLTGDFDGAVSTVSIDNVAISLSTSNVIPEPMSIAIWTALGVVALPARRFRRRLKPTAG